MNDLYIPKARPTPWWLRLLLRGVYILMAMVGLSCIIFLLWVLQAIHEGGLN